MKRVLIWLILSFLLITSAFWNNRYEIIFELYHDEEIEVIDERLNNSKKNIWKKYDVKKIDIIIKTFVKNIKNYEDLINKTDKVKEKVNELKDRYKDNLFLNSILDYYISTIDKEILIKIKSDINIFNEFNQTFIEYEKLYLWNPLQHSREWDYSKERVLLEARDEVRYSSIKWINSWILQYYNDNYEYPIWNNFKGLTSPYISEFYTEKLWNIVKNWCKFWFKYEVSKSLDQFRLSSCIEWNSWKFKDWIIEMWNFDKNFKANESFYMSEL